MQPNSPVPQPPISSMDYLNQISTPTPQKTMNPIILWGAIAGILVVAIIVFMMVLSSGTSNGDRITTIAAQLNSLKTISQGATENIQGSDLRTLNSSLTLVATNTIHGMSDTINALNGTDNEKDSRVQAVAATTKEITDRLENARLNSTYDRTYAREMAYYLKTLHSEMTELYDTTHNEAARSFLQKADTDISAFTQNFAAYNGS